MIKKLSFITLIIVFLCPTVFADMWDDAEAKGTNIEYYQYYNKDKDGFVYRGGIDYAPPYKPTEKLIEIHTNVEAGCGRFDWEVNLKNTLNQEALDRYWEALKGGAISSAPILLLEYISPTLADIVKHLKAMSNMSMEMQYASCERQQQLATNLGQSLRNVARNRYRSEQDPSDMKEANRLTNDYVNEEDWASGLNKYQGSGQIGSGEEGYSVIGQYLESKEAGGVGSTTRDYIAGLLGDVVIKGSGSINWKKPTIDEVQMYADIKKRQEEVVLNPIIRKLEKGGDFTPEDQAKLSRSDLIVTKEWMKDAMLLPLNEKEIVFRAYLTSYAGLETLDNLDKAQRDLEKGMGDPSISLEHRKYLAAKKDGIVIKKDGIVIRAEAQKRAYNTMFEAIKRSKEVRVRAVKDAVGTKPVSVFESFFSPKFTNSAVEE